MHQVILKVCKKTSSFSWRRKKLDAFFFLQPSSSYYSFAYFSSASSFFDNLLLSSTSSSSLLLFFFLQSNSFFLLILPQFLVLWLQKKWSLNFFRHWEKLGGGILLYKYVFRNNSPKGTHSMPRVHLRDFLLQKNMLYFLPLPLLSSSSSSFSSKSFILPRPSLIPSSIAPKKTPIRLLSVSREA